LFFFYHLSQIVSNNLLFKKIKLRFRFDVKQKQIMERKIFTLHFSPVDINEPAVDQKDYVYQPISLYFRNQICQIFSEINEITFFLVWQ
jgi:hypothetical protein